MSEKKDEVIERRNVHVRLKARKIDQPDDPPPKQKKKKKDE